jgi:hypothetical protein
LFGELPPHLHVLSQRLRWRFSGAGVVLRFPVDLEDLLDGFGRAARKMPTWKAIATACARFRAWSLLRMFLTWVRTVSTERCCAMAI